MRKFPCPKCGRPIQQSGAVSVGQDVFPVFQCDECLVSTNMMGADVEVALTFAVDATGKAFDPATPDGKLPI